MKSSGKLYFLVFFVTAFTSFLVASNAEAQHRPGMHSGFGEDADEGGEEYPTIKKILLDIVDGEATVNIAQHFEPGGPWGSTGPGADLAVAAAELDAAATGAFLIMWYQTDARQYFDFELEGAFDVNVYYIGTSVVNGVPCYQYHCELTLELHARYYEW